MVQDAYEMKAYATRKSFLFVLAFAWFLQSCASIQGPPGGPEDKTEPKILETTPKERQTSVSRNVRLHFKFVDALDKTSFLSAFSITPYIIGKLKYDWSGLDEVVVRLPDSLRVNTTYTISLSRDLKTKRGNSLKTPLHLTFSTGVAIDTGRLDGFLLPAMGSSDPLKASEIYLFAYDLGAHKADTLNYTHTPPDLMTQANDKGAFEFLAMKISNNYRVFAVQDVFRTHLYDKGVDSYGLPIGDVVMDSVVKSDVRVRMAVQVDTVKPELEDADAIDRYHLRVKFSKPLDTLSVAANNFQLVRKKDHSKLPIVAAFRDRPEKHGNEIVLITTAQLLKDTEYEVSGIRDSIHDLMHNRLSDSGYAATFSPLATQDTFLAPRLTAVPLVDSSRGNSVFPRLQFVWSDAIRRVSVDSAIQLFDSSRKRLPITTTWIDDSRFLISPKDTLKPLQFYTLKISTVLFRSPVESAARLPKDTLFNVRFQTDDFRDDGKLSGDVVVADSLWSRFPNGSVVIQLLDANGVTQQRVLHTHSTHYEFERVPRGSYRLRGYLANAGTLDFDAGSIIPFRFASPSGDYPTAIDVRPRWSTEKVDFPLK
jgi:hypothetical protein